MERAVRRRGKGRAGVLAAALVAAGALVTATLPAGTAAAVSGATDGPVAPALTGTPPAAFSVGWEHALAIGPDQLVRAWGVGINGSLGIGPRGDGGPRLPAVVQQPGGQPLAGICSVSAGSYFSLALACDGTPYAWGSNADGSVGTGTPSQNEPYAVPVVGPSGQGRLTGIAELAAGSLHALAVGDDGSLWSWGWNGHGQLGIGTTTLAQPVPMQVRGPGGRGFMTHVVGVAGGTDHSLALRADGTVWAWGGNASGQLGDGRSGPDATTPAPVLGPAGRGVLSGVVMISAGTGFSVALRADGTVWTWGANDSGQLGDGTTVNRLFPTEVLGAGGVGVFLGVTRIAAGTDHVVALAGDGDVWGWGSNAAGQLTADDPMVPTPLQAYGPHRNGVFEGASAVAAGQLGTEALRDDGILLGWGRSPAALPGSATPVYVRNLPKTGTPPVQLLLAPTLAPTAAGTAAVGTTLTSTPGQWGPPATGLAVQWLRDGTPIPDATGATYRVALADIGSTLSARWTASRTGYPDGVTTVDLQPVPRPSVVPAGPPVLGGRAGVHEVLTVSGGSWSPAATSLTYRWLRDGLPIDGATGSTYFTVLADRGHKVSVLVIAHRSGYNYATAVPKGLRIG